MTRLPVRRRLVAAIAGVLLGSAAASAVFGAAVRARVAAEAARRRLDIHVGSVGIGWLSVRLGNVVVGPAGVPAIRAHLAEVRVALDFGLHVVRFEVNGGELSLDGSASAIRDAWDGWQSRRPLEPSAAGAGVTALDVSAMTLRWVDGEGSEPAAELAGVAGTRDDRGIRLILRGGRARLAGTTLVFHDASLGLDKTGVLARVHATYLEADWTAPRPSTLIAVDPTPTSPGRAPATSIARASGPPRSQTAPASDPRGPLIPLPDLRVVRAKTTALANLLAHHIGEGADIGVDSLLWRVSQPSEPVPLTFGPGPFTLTRTHSLVELRYMTESDASGTPLALRARLPIGADDSELTLEGGPIALSILGIQEGAAGLQDVARATVAGRMRAALAADDSALTFEGEGAVRGLSLRQATLATGVVRGLDVTLRARGAITDTEIRLEDFGANLGALRLVASGKLIQTPDHVAGSARFEIPLATCDALLMSFPSGLLPALDGTAMAGTFAARGSFAFDTLALSDLHLDYDAEDLCRVVRVPAPLARERFEQPFVHRIYLPDGSTADQMTGPGTPNWTPLDQISPFMQAAVLTTEDGAFPRHHGFNHAAIRSSIVANIKARRFVRGASTITMQLAKNLFLSRDKTLSRKLEEVILTDYLERTFSKDELMELYLNVIEFGPGVYGITAASDYFFGRAPDELNFAECLFLSSVLPAPLRYAAMRDGDEPPDSWQRTLHHFMQIARKNGQITDVELTEAESERVIFWHGGPRPPARPPVRLRLPLEGDDTDAPPPFEPDAP